MTALKAFTRATQRMLPVILLADTSGSMSGDGKIQALNAAVREMLATFRDDRTTRAEIQVAVITFGGTAAVHQSLTPANRIEWRDLPTDGGTPLGGALDLAQRLIDDTEALPSTAFRPTVVLVSDGCPTDEWVASLERFNAGRRTGKTQRLAMAIGADADEAMLRRFLNSGEEPLFHAGDAAQVSGFFRYVSQSVALRSRSVDPNQIPSLPRPVDVDVF